MILESLKGLGRTFVEILGNRVETLSLDLKEDRIRFVSLLLLGASAFFVLSLGIILVVFFLVLTFWTTNRLMVIGILTAMFLCGGLILLALLVQRVRHLPGPFEGTLSELYKDRDALDVRKKGKEQ
jgi:uncharacterized membrane protein YqjE